MGMIMRKWRFHGQNLVFTLKKVWKNKIITSNTVSGYWYKSRPNPLLDPITRKNLFISSLSIMIPSFIKVGAIMNFSDFVWNFSSFEGRPSWIGGHFENFEKWWHIYIRCIIRHQYTKFRVNRTPFLHYGGHLGFKMAAITIQNGCHMVRLFNLYNPTNFHKDWSNNEF